MKIVDLNILLYVVNKDDPRHEQAWRWWHATLNSGEPIGFAWITLVGYLRIATHPSVFANPQTTAEALGRVDSWLDHPHAQLVTEADDHWRILSQLLRETGTVGNRATDAHLAALTISRGATLVSYDADFSRFRQLRWENPAD